MKKLLTVAIPTYNRDKYLYSCLSCIYESFSRLNELDRNSIEIIVSDNSENNDSLEVVRLKEFSKLRIIYIKNIKNIGSDQNLANSYIKSNSTYSMLIGDDDYVEKCFFKEILPILRENIYNVIFFKYYGHTYSSLEKSPKIKDRNVIFNNPEDALFDRNISITFISGMILRRDCLNEVEINNGVGTNLVQVNACFRLLGMKNAKSILINKFLVGAVRNNSGGYNPVEIFLNKFFSILKDFNNFGMTSQKLKKLKNKILYTFYTRNFAQYMKKKDGALSKNDFDILDKAYSSNIIYLLFIKRLFKKNNKFNYTLLSIIYICANVIYYPSKIFDFLRHFKNLLNRTLKINIKKIKYKKIKL